MRKGGRPSFKVFWLFYNDPWPGRVALFCVAHLALGSRWLKEFIIRGTTDYTRHTLVTLLHVQLDIGSRELGHVLCNFVLFQLKTLIKIEEAHRLTLVYCDWWLDIAGPHQSDRWTVLQHITELSLTRINNNNSLLCWVSSLDLRFCRPIANATVQNYYNSVSRKTSEGTDICR